MKLPNLKSKTRPKQLLGSVSLAFVLHNQGDYTEKTKPHDNDKIILNIKSNRKYTKGDQYFTQPPTINKVAAYTEHV